MELNKYPVQQTALATLTIFSIFAWIISFDKKPRPQSGAKINLSLSMCFKASFTLASIFSCDSIADLATVTTPNITVAFLKLGNNSSKLLHASASSIEN